MNESKKAHEHYKKMIGMTGKFTVEFHNFSTYEIPTLNGGTIHWDEATGTGHAELQTKSGKILFDFTQVKKVK